MKRERYDSPAHAKPVKLTNESRANGRILESTGLQLESKSDVGRADGNEILEAGNALLPPDPALMTETEGGKIVKRKLLNGPASVRHPLQIRIMETDEGALCSDPYVGLEQICAFADRHLERGDGILRTLSSVAPVGNDQEAGVTSRLRELDATHADLPHYSATSMSIWVVSSLNISSALLNPTLLNAI